MGASHRVIRLAVAALSLAAAGFAAAREPAVYTLESVRQVPVHDLAARLLGPELAANVERFEAADLGLIAQLSAVYFFDRPAPLSGGFCGRRLHRVNFEAVDPVGGSDTLRPEQARMRAGHIVTMMQVALAPGCRMVPGQAFAYLNPDTSLDAAMAALGRLAAARAAAAARGALPFRLACRDELEQGGCGGGGRRALAGLRIEQASLIEGRGSSVLVGEPGQIFWQVAFAETGGTRPGITMTRRIPPPF